MSGIVKIIESYDRLERVIIAKRSDGNYTYRRQWALPATDAVSSATLSCVEDRTWGEPGPDAGIYDSPDTAETEARQRVPWLRRHSH